MKGKHTSSDVQSIYVEVDMHIIRLDMFRYKYNTCKDNDVISSSCLSFFACLRGCLLASLIACSLAFPFVCPSVCLSVLLWLQTRGLSSKMECSGLDWLIYKSNI